MVGGGSGSYSPLPGITFACRPWQHPVKGIEGDRICGFRVHSLDGGGGRSCSGVVRFEKIPGKHHLEGSARCASSTGDTLGRTGRINQSAGIVPFAVMGRPLGFGLTFCLLMPDWADTRPAPTKSTTSQRPNRTTLKPIGK